MGGERGVGDARMAGLDRGCGHRVCGAGTGGTGTRIADKGDAGTGIAGTGGAGTGIADTGFAGTAIADTGASTRVYGHRVCGYRDCWHQS